MKFLATTPLLFSTLLSTQAFARGVATPQYENRETIVHSTKSIVDVDLNEKTVICSRADYMMPMLKVLIPGLEGITLLDHQNTGAGAPCVTTGETCMGTPKKPGARPDDILQGRSGTEKVEVIVTAKRIDTIDHVNKTCEQTLVETVETIIRGKKLIHERTSPGISHRSYAQCVNGGV